MPTKPRQSNRGSGVRASAPRIVDGNRHRCLICGHPRKEHRAQVCTVPKCPCAEYTMRGIRGHTDAA